VPRNELLRESPPANTDTPTDPRVKLAPLKQGMREFVVPLSEGNKAVFQWPTALTQADIDDLKDSIKILERKIDRSLTQQKTEQ
jgi:hypothetical protein